MKTYFNTLMWVEIIWFVLWILYVLIDTHWKKGENFKRFMKSFFNVLVNYIVGIIAIIFFSIPITWLRLLFGLAEKVIDKL